MEDYKFIDKTQPLPPEKKGSTQLYFVDENLKNFCREYMERTAIETGDSGDLEEKV